MVWLRIILLSVNLGKAMKFLSTEQVAERLNLSTGRIRRMILDGIIKDVQRFGQRSLMIPEREVKRLEEMERPRGRPRSRPEKE